MGIHVGYEPARVCTGSATQGARALMSWFLGAYGKQGAKNLGIYNCRAIAGSATTSLHGEGRAADLGVPVGAGWAQTLADRLVARSGELGIQCVIYSRRIWSGSYPHAGWRPYKGSHPHTDHLHVELAWNTARTLTSPRIQTILGGAPAPGAGTRPTLRYGSRGTAVREAQQRLTAHGAGPGSVDGIFGAKTLNAVKRFQTRRTLATDGVIGPKTWAALLTAPPKSAAPARPALRRGSKGDAVRLIQRFLGIPDDGIFGPVTEQKVKNYQRMRGLAVDGIVGPKTWAATNL